MAYTLTYRDGSKDTSNETVHFEVIWDQDYECYIVRKASRAYSFSEVPANFTSEFSRADKAKAYEQVRRLTKWQAKGNVIELQHIETPGAFEAVADKKYGCAWGEY